MSDVTLWGVPFSTFTWTVRLALKEKGVPYELVRAVPDSEEQLARHPFGRVPAFQHGDVRLIESAAICVYIDEAFEGPALQPASPREKARMWQWISVISDYVDKRVTRAFVLPQVLADLDNSMVERVQQALPEARETLQILDSALGDGRPCLCGKYLTLADLFLLPVLHHTRRSPAGPDALRGMASLARWYAGMITRPSFQDTVPVVRTAA